MADFFITGATGFIGRHLIERLRAERHTLRCLVRRKRAFMCDYPEIRWVLGDLNDPDRYRHELADVDYVVHLAGLISSRRRENYYDVNVGGTRNLLQACRDGCRRLSRFLHMSSIAVVGASSENIRLTEDDRPRPETIYGKSKLLAEDEVLRYTPDLPVAILRPTFIYGPGDIRGLRLLKLLSEQDELISFSIVETASVCYIHDLVSACLLALTQPISSGEIFNISDPEVYTWKHIHAVLTKVIGELYPDPGDDNFIFTRRFYDRPELTPAGVGIRPQRKYWGCSIKKAETILGFRPEYTLYAGARQTIAWYRDHRMYHGRSSNTNALEKKGI